MKDTIMFFAGIKFKHESFKQNLILWLWCRDGRPKDNFAIRVRPIRPHLNRKVKQYGKESWWMGGEEEQRRGKTASEVRKVGRGRVERGGGSKREIWLEPRRRRQKCFMPLDANGRGGSVVRMVEGCRITRRR